MTQTPFLIETDHALLRHHLRGVRMIELRQIGGPPEAGAEVVAHLESLGFAVRFRMLERMSPPPLLRIVFRYPGPRQAEMTIAPELGR
jgi:hypothetical protein